MVKEFLSQKGIGFKEHDVSRDRAAAQELVDRTGQMGVPVTVIDGQIIIGFDRARLEQALNMEQQRERHSFGAAIADASKITARQGLGITLIKCALPECCNAFGAQSDLRKNFGLDKKSIIKKIQKK